MKTENLSGLSYVIPAKAGIQLNNEFARSATAQMVLIALRTVITGFPTSRE
jgi:hypothetical protein